MAMEDTNTKILTEFFEFIWGDIEGYVYLPTKDATGVWKKVCYKWPLHKRAVVQHVFAASAGQNDVFFSPALYKEPIPRKDFVLGSNVFWTEFDGNAPSEWPSTANDLVTGQPAAVPGPPSLQVQSSGEGNKHCYWKLNEFIQDSGVIENVNRAIAYGLQADTSGWDATQILRPPLTVNYKYKKQTFVTIDSYTGELYDSKLFATPPIKELVSSSIDETNLPSIIDIIGKYTWDKDNLELLEKSELPEGMRSSCMMRIAFRSAELGLSDEEAYALLIYVDDKWGKFKLRTDRKRRLTDMINKARLKYPQATEALEFTGLLIDSPVAKNIKIAYGFQEFLQSDFKVEWVVKDLIPHQGITMVIGDPNVGKTQFLLGLGMRSCLGQSFVGWHSVKKHRQVLFSLEMNGPFLKHFVTNMAGAYTSEEIEHLERNFIIVPIGEAIPIHHPEGKTFIENILSEYQPEGIIIDSYGKIMSGNLSDDELNRKTFAYLNFLRMRFGCYINIIHHNRKAQSDNKRPRELSDVYGSRYITADSDVVLSLWRPDGGDYIEVKSLKNRLAPTRSTFKIKRVANLQFELSDEVPEGLMSHVGATNGSATDATTSKPIFPKDDPLFRLS